LIDDTSWFRADAYIFSNFSQGNKSRYFLLIRTVLKISNFCLKKKQSRKYDSSKVDYVKNSELLPYYNDNTKTQVKINEEKHT